MTIASSAAFHTEVCVIGAGVVGLAIARALSLVGKEVLLVDQASTIGSETSSRNSEVIHAGLYYPSHSHKAKFCVSGKKDLYQYCRQHDIPFHNCGKLIVATHPDQLTGKLEQLRNQAIKNGVDDVKILSQEDVRILEPQVECVGALLSPSTGVLDSHSFMMQLLADAQSKGTILALNTQVKEASADLRLTFNDGTQLDCGAVVNASGLWAHRIAQLFHSHSSIDQDYQVPSQFFCKGTYFRLQGVARPFQHLIYPVPGAGGLGVHATLDWAGQSIKFGPDVEWVDEDVCDPRDIALSPDETRGEIFAKEIRKYWPILPDNALVADYVGIRPKLNHPRLGRLGFEDFQIHGPSTHGINGLIHLLGIESPGLTSSLAIGDYVAQILQN